MLSFRLAGNEDVDLFFDWANDPLTRSNSYNKEPIPYEDHVKWFNQQLESTNNRFYVFLNEEGIPVGQVRISSDNLNEAIISLLVDIHHRGKGYATEMIEKASDDFLLINSGYRILAYIFKTNQASCYSFLKAGYTCLKEDIIKSVPSYILYKSYL